MTTVIPAKLLKMKVLAEVPRSLYANAPALTDARDDKKRQSFLKMLRKGAAQKQEAQTQAAGKMRTQSLSLNAAVWMRVQEVPTQPVSLVLYYKDQKGEFAVMVDEAPVGLSKCVMLSGSVTIEAKGDVEFIRACCAGVDPSQIITVDEIYVQKNADLQKPVVEDSTNLRYRSA